MREVRTCDFCGADGRGVYEVLPPEIDGGRRMVLCPPCKERLEDVVAPLLDRLDSDAEVTHARAEERVRAGERGSAREEERPTERSAERRRERGKAREAPATADEDEGELETEAAAVDTSEESLSEGGDGDAEDTASESAASEEIQRAAAAPPAYRKVVRFLQNREFPMHRGEAEGLAAGAYGLDEEVVHKIVEHAISEGRFESEGGTLTLG